MLVDDQVLLALFGFPGVAAELEDELIAVVHADLAREAGPLVAERGVGDVRRLAAQPSLAPARQGRFGVGVGVVAVYPEPIQRRGEPRELLLEREFDAADLARVDVPRLDRVSAQLVLLGEREDRIVQRLVEDSRRHDADSPIVMLEQEIQVRRNRWIEVRIPDHDVLLVDDAERHQVDEVRPGDRGRDRRPQVGQRAELVLEMDHGEEATVVVLGRDRCQRLFFRVEVEPVAGDVGVLVAHAGEHHELRRQVDFGHRVDGRRRLAHFEVLGLGLEVQLAFENVPEVVQERLVLVLTGRKRPELVIARIEVLELERLADVLAEDDVGPVVDQLEGFLVDRLVLVLVAQLEADFEASRALGSEPVGDREIDRADEVEVRRLVVRRLECVEQVRARGTAHRIGPDVVGVRDVGVELDVLPEEDELPVVGGLLPSARDGPAVFQLHAVADQVLAAGRDVEVGRLLVPVPMRELQLPVGHVVGERQALLVVVELTVEAVQEQVGPFGEPIVERGREAEAVAIHGVVPDAHLLELVVPRADVAEVVGRLQVVGAEVAPAERARRQEPELAVAGPRAPGQGAAPGRLVADRSVASGSLDREQHVLGCLLGDQVHRAADRLGVHVGGDRLRDRDRLQHLDRHRVQPDLPDLRFR